MAVVYKFSKSYTLPMTFIYVLLRCVGDYSQLQLTAVKGVTGGDAGCVEAAALLHGAGRSGRGASTHLSGPRPKKRALMQFLPSLGHSLRLNADVVDTASQKSLRQFCKYCWTNLNYGKIHIFISNTFSFSKFIFFC